MHFTTENSPTPEKHQPETMPAGVALFDYDGDGLLDIYLVNDALKKAGWRMNALQLPPALHFCITRPNTKPGVAQSFLADLQSAVQYARDHRGKTAESGAMYGLGHTPAAHEALDTVMAGVLDAMHEVAPE